MTIPISSPASVRLCRGISVLFFTWFLFLPVSGVQAGPAYRTPTTSDPALDLWNEGFTVSLDLNRKLCEQKYGKNWPQECAAPPAGRPGRQVEGVRMTPAEPGVWRWSDGNTMRFEPKNRLKPGVRYRVSLENVALPARYSLSRTSLDYVTLPQAVRPGAETFWIDPSDRGAHALSVPLSFLWPADRAAVEAGLSLVPLDPKSGLRFGKPHLVWNEGGDELVVNAPLLSLPEKSAAARLEIRGLPEYRRDKNGRRVVSGTDGKAPATRVQFGIKGSRELMDVTEIRIVPGYGPNLEREYHLEVETSLQTRPVEVLGHLELRHLPRKSGDAAGRDCDWTVMPAVGAEDLARSEPLTASLLQPGGEPATVTRLRVPAEAGRGLMAAMRDGLPSTGGLKLNRVRRFILNVPSFDAELHILQPGNILSLSGSQHLDIHSVGLSSIRWRVERVREPFLALLAANAGFTNPDDTDFDTLSGSAQEGRLDIAPGRPGEAVFSGLDLSSLHTKGANRSGLLRLTLTGYDGDVQVCRESRLLLLTDLGIMVKQAADGSHAVFVRHLTSGLPAAGVDVALLGANGLPVQHARSDISGRADLPSSAGLDRERRPVAVTASKGFGSDADLSWLSLRENSRRTDYSRFAVGGRSLSAGGLIASVFSQRGIYVPGETLHFGCIVRHGDRQDVPSDLKLAAVLYSPTGGKVMEETPVLGREGMASLSWRVPEDAPAGTWRLDLRLGGEGGPILGGTTVRVEEFRPDTLSLHASFEPRRPRGWIVTAPGEKAAASVRLDNLYGEAAAGHRLRAELQTSPAVLHFSGYEDFSFPQAAAAGRGTRFELFEGYTDESGKALLPLPQEKLPAGVFSGVILLEGFEAEGGRAVTGTLSALFAPQKLALGYKPEKSANNLEYVPQNAQAGLRLLVLNNNLDPVPLSGASITLSARRYVNSLVGDARGNYRYDAVPVDTELSRMPLNIPAVGLSWDLPTAEAGDFLITIRDAEGGVLATIPYSVAGLRLARPESLSPDALNRGDLRLKLEKTNLASGDTLRFRLSAPFAGTGLITIERDRVVNHAWFRTEAGESVQEIVVPADFEGRGYLNVSFVRDFASEAVYMDPHAYAAAPFTAGVDRRDMGLRLEVPRRVLPGEDLVLKISARHSGAVQVFAVDEGVLQLTGFVTPSPLQDLLLDRALEVETRQAFDLLMPDPARIRGRIPGFGGGMDGSGGRFFNPFKRKNEPPLAFWSPLLETGPEGRELRFPIPSWSSGRIRIMAVGAAAPKGAPPAAGSTEAFTELRGNLILKPQLPLAVAPGDEFEGALVVANTVEGSGAGAVVRVDMELPHGVEAVEGTQERKLAIDENGEAGLRFRLRASEDLGEAELVFRACLEKDGKTVERRQSLSVRPVTPRLRSEQAVALTGSVRIAAERRLYPHQAETRLSVAAAPVLALRSLVRRLDAYPYGCTEQRISRALPHVALWNMPDVQAEVMKAPGLSSEELRKRRDEAISQAVAAVRASLSWDGVSPWPGGRGDLFVTAYAADFLVSMRESGMAVPEGLAVSVLDCLERQVNRTPESVNDGRLKIYGAWVLLRDGRIMTTGLNMLEGWFKENADHWEKDVLSALLADGFRMLRLKRRGTERLPDGAVQTTDDPRFSTGMARALYALILHRSFTEHTGRVSMEALLDAAFNEQAGTVDMAMSARALAVLAQEAKPDPSSLRLTCEAFDPGFRDTAEPVFDGAALVLNAPGCRSFRVEKTGETSGNLYAHLVEDGYDREMPSPAAEGMELHRRYLDMDGEPVTQVHLGQAVIVELCGRAVGDPIQDAVLADLVPGGVEPVLEKDAPSEAVPGLIRHERREDRVLFFVNLGLEQSCFRYRARAVTRGRFTLPPATAQAMYAPEHRAVSGGGTLLVR